MSTARGGRLPDDQIADRLKVLTGWDIVGGKLHRVFQFGSFAEAFGFMASAAIIAQAMDHHPDWCNTYDKVVVKLSSHDVQGISERDFDLAHKMNELTG